MNKNKDKKDFIIIEYYNSNQKSYYINKNLKKEPKNLYQSWQLFYW